MSIDNYETGFSGRNIWSEKGGTDMERHEVISIEEYLAKRKAKREQENHKEKELREDTDNKKTQDRAYGADPLCGLLRKAILRTEVV